MNELMVFKNPEFGSIRTLEIDEQPYWVAIDVAKALGYEKPGNAVSQHCKATLKQGVLDKRGVNQQTRIIPESDLYRLIVHSKLPSAERFEKWVFDEVLPTIRKTGTYQIAPTGDNTKTEQLIQEISEMRRGIEALSNKLDLKRVSSKSFYKTNSEGIFWKDYINYLLSILEQTLDMNRANMLHQAYVTLQTEADANLDALKRDYKSTHGVTQCSMLDAICSDTLTTRNLANILHLNIEIAIMNKEQE